MIIELVMTVVYNIFELLTRPINIPDLPADIVGVIMTAADYMTMGGQLLANYTHLPYLMTLFGFIIAVEVGYHVYNMIMWVLKKIPFLGVQ